METEAAFIEIIEKNYDQKRLYQKISFFANRLHLSIQNELKGIPTPPPTPPPFYKRKKKLSKDDFLPFPEIRL
jgi:hypothetical protein